MISMKLDKKKKDEMFEKQSYALEDTPDYPYNLKIWLEDEQIKKLGLQDCAVGDEKLAAMVNDTAKAVADMDLATEAKTSAVNTINGYINGVRGRSAVLNLTMTQAAQSAMNAWKSALDEHSPSRKMMESGENTIKGAIIGVEAMKSDLSKAYSDAASLAQLSFNSIRPEGFVRDSRQSINHTGTIRVEGVSNSGELIGAYDIIVEQLRREARM